MSSRSNAGGNTSGFGPPESASQFMPSLIGDDEDDEREGNGKQDAPSPFQPPRQSNGSMMEMPEWDISAIYSGSPAVHRKRPRRSMGAALPSRPSRPSRLLAGRGSRAASGQPKKRRTTIGGQSSNVAQRILSTLGKMSTPLDEARRRRVPSALATKWVLDRYKETSAKVTPKLLGPAPPQNSLAMPPKLPSAPSPLAPTVRPPVSESKAASAPPFTFASAASPVVSAKSSPLRPPSIPQSPSSRDSRKAAGRQRADEGEAKKTPAAGKTQFLAGTTTGLKTQDRPAKTPSLDSDTNAPPAQKVVPTYRFTQPPKSDVQVDGAGKRMKLMADAQIAHNTGKRNTFSSQPANDVDASLYTVAKESPSQSARSQEKDNSSKKESS